MNTGKISGNVLKRSVLRQLQAEREEIRNGAGIGEDCAVFSFPDSLTVSCMQEAPVRMPPDFQGLYPSDLPALPLSWLILKCANNLAAAGAEPVAVLVTLLLPEAVEEGALKAWMAEADSQCRRLGMAVAGGQSRVTKAVSCPVAVLSGLGKLPCGREDSLLTHGAHTAAPGQDVVLSKWIGLEGTALLAQRYREGLLERYPAYLVEEAAGFGRYLSVLPEAAAAIKSGACALHDASEGGIFAALWELAEAAGVGLTIDLKKLPLKQATVEICEYCGANPYQLLSGGCLVMTAQDGPGLAAALKAEGIHAAVVGKVTDTKKRILLNQEEVRYMDRPGRDELYRVFEKG